LQTAVAVKNLSYLWMATLSTQQLGSPHILVAVPLLVQIRRI